MSNTAETGALPNNTDIPDNNLPLPAPMDSDKRQMTILEYIIKNLETVLYGLRNALGVWGALVTTVFLKLTNNGYKNLALAMLFFSIFQILYGFLAARIADRIRKYKRVIAFMHLPVVIIGMLAAVPIALMFPNLGDTPKILYIVSVNVLQTLLSAISQNCWNILDARLTPSSKDRALLGVFSNILNGIGSLSAPIMSFVVLIFGKYVLFSAEMDANAYYYFYGTVLFSLCLLPVNYLWLAVRKVRIPAPKTEKPTNIIETTKGMLKNKPLWLKKISQTICEWAGITGSFFSLLVARYYYGIEYNIFGWHYTPDLGMLHMIFSFTVTIPAALSLLLMPKLRKHFSDKAMFMFSGFFIGFTNILLLFGASGVFFQVTLMQRYIIHMVCYGLSGCVNGMNVCSSIMDLELLDYTEWQTGQRNESTYNFVLGNIFKPVTLPIAYAGAALLIASGYNTEISEGVLDEAVVRNMLAYSAGFSALFNIVGMIPMFFYRFSGNERKKIMDELAERRKLHIPNLPNSPEHNPLNQNHS